MCRVCMLYSRDHTRHIIIRRQIESLLDEGYDILMIEEGTRGISETTSRPYTVQITRAPKFRAFVRLMWAVLRRLDHEGLNEIFWIWVDLLQHASIPIVLFLSSISHDVDVYHAHDVWALCAAVLVSRLRHKPVIYDAHELESEQGDPRALRNRLIRFLLKWLVPQAEQVIVPNQARATFVKSEFSPSQEPVVIRNCPPSRQVKASDKLRSRLGLSSETQIVLYHGALIPGRALDHLVLSASQFSKNVSLVIIGEQNSYYSNALAPLLAQKDLYERVHFLPFISHDEIWSYIASADLGVVIYEDINLNNRLCAPTKLYEYLMTGVPIVASDSPGLRDFITENSLGFVFDPNEPDSIAGAVNRFIELDTASREKIQVHIDQVRERYTWESEGERLRELYADLLGSLKSIVVSAGQG